ncbi:MAG: hypothetical protein IJH64_15020 [Oscillospiraceae bacterium]|nr:hypothetical protein [Oscillospiraceae bacterium]MBR0452129.1 hypothetical protein [Oscillospiraceae bacterium]
MNITEKVAYLKGLIEGSDLKLGEKEEKIFKALIEVVDDMAQVLSECDDDLTALYDQVDELEDEVADIEDDLDVLFDDEDYDFDDEDDYDEDDDPLYEVDCPECGRSFSIDEDTLLNGNNLKCPFCGHEIKFELFDEDDYSDED